MNSLTRVLDDRPAPQLRPPLTVYDKNCKRIPAPKFVRHAGGEIDISGITGWIDENGINSGEPGTITLLKLTDTSSDGLMALKLFVDVLTNSCKNLSSRQISLFVPYLPAARSDRVTPTAANALRSYASLVNSMEFGNVVTLDAHSVASFAAYDRLVSVENDDFVSLGSLGPDFVPRSDCHPLKTIILIPDAGAEKRVQKIVSKLSEPLAITSYSVTNERFTDVIPQASDLIIAQAIKSRDPVTGAPTAQIFMDQQMTSEWKRCHVDVLIFDDMCDGGRTYADLARHIRSRLTALVRPERITVKLIVSNSICSYGTSQFIGPDMVDYMLTRNHFPYNGRFF